MAAIKYSDYFPELAYLDYGDVAEVVSRTGRNRQVRFAINTSIQTSRSEQSARLKSPLWIPPPTPTRSTTWIDRQTDREHDSAPQHGQTHSVSGSDSSRIQPYRAALNRTYRSSKQGSYKAVKFVAERSSRPALDASEKRPQGAVDRVSSSSSCSVASVAEDLHKGSPIAIHHKIVALSTWCQPETQPRRSSFARRMSYELRRASLLRQGLPAPDSTAYPWLIRRKIWRP